MSKKTSIRQTIAVPAFLLFIVFLVGCTTTARHWEQTLRTNTIQAYEDFLKQRANSRYAAEAKQRLAVLYTEREWAQTRSSETVAAYEEFLRNHPDADQASQAKLRLMELRVGEAWGEASSADTIAAYRNFLAKYPQSKQAKEASTRLLQLESERDWTRTKSSGTVAAYKEFLQKHPGSKEAAGARQELEGFEADQDWKSTQAADSAPAYQEFLRNHATSKYATQAQKRLTFLQAAAESRMVAENQSGEMDLPYELVPLSTALETGRISGLAANNLSVGQSIHQDTMRRLIDDMEARCKSLGPGDALRETIDVLLREVREVRNVARHQILVFDKGSGNIIVISKAYADLLERGFRGYGVVLPSLHWGYMPPFAREASRADWQGARAARVNAGRWAGAYLLNGKQLLLPGFQALDELSKPLTTREQEARNVDPSFDTQEVAALRAKASAARVSEVYIVVGDGGAPLFAEVDRLILWNQAAKRTYGSVDAVRQTGNAGVIEPGVNWVDPFGELLRSAGITEGFVETKLYEIWHPRFVKPGRGEGSHRALIYEHWIGALVGRATVTKGR